MKKQILILSFTLAAISNLSAQDITQNQVPSIIINKFNTEFPKATDIEWEINGDLYNVDFEIGWHVDHEVWYNSEGKIVKHKEDITKNELPKPVYDRIKTDFKSYSINDLERITENGKTVYKMELHSLMQTNWDVVIGSKGNIISKVID